MDTRKAGQPTQPDDAVPRAFAGAKGIGGYKRAPLFRKQAHQWAAFLDECLMSLGLCIIIGAAIGLAVYSSDIWGGEGIPIDTKVLWVLGGVWLYFFGRFSYAFIQFLRKRSAGA